MSKWVTKFKKVPLIKSLWILDNRSGIACFEQIYEDITKDGIESGLILPFFTAVNLFAQESFAKEIQHIKMQDLMFYFESNKFNTVIVATKDTKDISEKEIKTLLKNVLNEFKRRYKEDLKEEWKGDLSQFEEFAFDLMDITGQKPLELKLMLFPGMYQEKIKEKKDKLKDLFDANLRLKDQIKDTVSSNEEKDDKFFEDLMGKVKSLGKEKKD